MNFLAEATSTWSLPDHMAGDLIATATFGLLGIALLIIGYKVFDWAIRGVDFDKEISERNTAAGVVVAAVILGLTYFVASVVKAIIG